MLAFFHGQELGVIFGMPFAAPPVIGIFLLYRWKPQHLLPKILKSLLFIVALLVLVFAIDLLWIGLREIKDLYL